MLTSGLFMTEGLLFTDIIPLYFENQTVYSHISYKNREMRALPPWDSPVYNIILFLTAKSKSNTPLI